MIDRKLKLQRHGLESQRTLPYVRAHEILVVAVHISEMASGDPLDMQRTARWPQYTSTNGGLRVKFSKEDEDSDALPSDDDDDDDDDDELTAGWNTD
jgi:hypothetical protein